MNYLIGAYAFGAILFFIAFIALNWSSVHGFWRYPFGLVCASLWPVTILLWFLVMSQSGIQ